jgi:uncharacterized protein (DUF924 family)
MAVRMETIAGDILAFWFADAHRGPAETQARQAFWFSGDTAVDAAIRDRYLPFMEAAQRGDLAGWSAEPNHALALVLLLDQFPRNAWRGTARAFSGDVLALATARAAVEAGFLERIELAQRAFLLLPYEHSESRADQRESLRLFSALRAGAPAPWHALFDGYLHYAREHSAIVERFGRFPHRNRVLGRESTPDERAWLEAGGASFGQG